MASNESWNDDKGLAPQLREMAERRGIAPEDAKAPAMGRYGAEASSSEKAQLAAALQSIENRLAALGGSQDLDRRIEAVDRALGDINREAPPAAEASGASTADAEWMAGLDEAVAEIAQRQRALDKRDVPDAALSLEQQFAVLSQRMRPADPDPSSSRHATESNIQSAHPHAASRDELAVASRRGETATRPTLQARGPELRTPAEDIRDTRHGTAESPTLMGIEQGLVEVRSALAHLPPADDLAVFRHEVRTLDDKIETMAAKGVYGPSIKELAAAVAELRQIATQAASGEALFALAEEVQALGNKVDKLSDPVSSGSDLLSKLDHRFEALASELSARGQIREVAATADLVSKVETLTNKVESVELGQDNAPALEAIVEQLRQLSERVESSDARLENLAHIERSVVELLDRLDGVRADAVAAAEEAAREFFDRSAALSEADSIRQDLDALRERQTHSERHTQDTLEAVHGTLERLVDRLALVETDVRREVSWPLSTPTPAMEPSYSPSIAPMQAAGEPVRIAPAPTEMARRPVPPAVAGSLTSSGERSPIDPTLPADTPLEPGAARSRPTSAAERVAASEAALGPAKPASEQDAKSNFIAAARRAAQAAANMPAEPAVAPEKSSSSTLGAIAQKITGRRSLVLGLGFLISVGALHYVLNMSPFADNWRSAAVRLVNRATTPASEPAKIATAAIKPPATAVPPANPLALSLPVESKAAPEAKGDGAQDLASASTASPALSSQQEARATPTVSPLTIATIQLPTGGDVTGALGRATGVGRKPAETGATLPPPPLQSAASARGDAIPAGLRAAASAGNPAAEYEIATRYAEGRGVPPNLEEAARWFERAANQSIAPAQYRLGSLYEKGQGVKKDIEQARRLYRAAAEKGHGKAMHNLAVLHAEGVDGKPDFKAAAGWFRKAAERGLADSQYNLAILHARGMGVEQNLAESYKWFALAAQQGDQDSGKKRDEIAARLDQPATMAARLAVQTFTAVAQPPDAVTVKGPAGGWDNFTPAASAEKPKNRPTPSRKIGPS